MARLRRPPSETVADDVSSGGLIGWSYIILVVSAVLLQGGARPYSWILNAYGFGALALAFGIGTIYAGNGLPVAWRWIRLESLLFLSVLCWTIIQIVATQPLGLGQPIWDEAAALLGRPLIKLITLAPEDGWNMILRLSTVSIVAWLGLQLGRDVKWARALLYAILAAGAANTVYGAVVMAMKLSQSFADKAVVEAIDTGLFDASVAGTFVNRSLFATYSAICAVTGLALTLEPVESARRGRKTSSRESMRVRSLSSIDFRGLAVRAAVWVGVFICFFGVVSSGSRLGLFAAIASILWLALLLVLRDPRRGGGAILPMLLAGFLAFSIGGHWVVHRLGFLEGAMTQRFAVYGVVWSAILENFWTGIGAGAFIRGFPIYRTTAVEVGGFWNVAHSAFLESALTLGVPATLLLLTAFARLWLRCVRGALERRRQFSAPLAGAAAGMVMFLDSTFNFAIQNDSIALMIAAIMGVALAQSWSSREFLSDAETTAKSMAPPAYETAPEMTP